jgi:hypothetical protein
MLVHIEMIPHRAGDVVKAGTLACKKSMNADKFLKEHRPEGTPQRPRWNRSAVFGWAPARLNWPVSAAARHAE